MIIELAIRLHKLPHELDALQMPEVAELIACLSDGRKDPDDVEAQLLKVFGKRA